MTSTSSSLRTVTRGLPADQYREYVDPKFRENYDEFVAEAENMRNARMGPSESRDTWVAEWRDEIEDHGGHARLVGRQHPRQGARRRRRRVRGDLSRTPTPRESVACRARRSAPGLGSSGDSDPVLVMEGAKAHNRWLADLCAASPERRVGVALVPILHNHEAAIEEIAGPPTTGSAG